MWRLFRSPKVGSPWPTGNDFHPSGHDVRQQGRRYQKGQFLSASTLIIILSKLRWPCQRKVRHDSDREADSSIDWQLVLEEKFNQWLADNGAVMTKEEFIKKASEKAEWVYVGFQSRRLYLLRNK